VSRKRKVNVRKKPKPGKGRKNVHRKWWLDMIGKCEFDTTFSYVLISKRRYTSIHAIDRYTTTYPRRAELMSSDWKKV
jgi:hypothetical protein